MYLEGSEGDTMLAMAKERKPAKRERPTSLVMTVKCEGDLLTAFLDFLEDQRVSPAKSDVIELALQEFFQREGYFPPPD